MNKENTKPVVGIIMGSSSDLTIMSAAGEMLKQFGVPYEITVVSAHRAPDRMLEYARTALSRGLQVIIAGAGGAAHLPGMAAALTTLPVIGVPINSGNSIAGIDSLLSIVQMPSGVPVATVSINGAKNAGILAAEMVALSQPAVAQALIDYKVQLNVNVETSAKRVSEQQ